MAAYRFADVPQRRPRSRFTLDYNVSDRLQLGFEYNFLVSEFGFRSSVVVSRESEFAPMMHLNVSSDRIGTPPGYMQVSLTAAKSVPGTNFAPYVSLAYSGFEKGLVVPFGLNVQLDRRWSILVMNDGRKTHALMNHAASDYYVQVGWIWLRHMSITVGWGF